MILICVAIFLLMEWLFIGYRFNFGPFKGLGDIRMEKIEGNTAVYNMEHVPLLEGNPLQKKNVCFLGSSVTHGAASLREGIPEYFGARFGCSFTKEAVSGTTLVGNGKSSYVQRMRNNLDPNKEGICWPSIPTIAKDLKLSESTVRRALGDLRKAGLVRTEQRYRENGGNSKGFY